MTTVIGELQSYMDGEFSLADAVKDLKETRSQVRIRDEQLTQLTALVNSFQININEILEENLVLRYSFNFFNFCFKLTDLLLINKDI